MSSNKNTGPQDQTSEDMLKLVAFGMVAILGALLSAVILPGILFAYLAWASFYIKDERKYIRTLVIIAAGFFITEGLYDSFKAALPWLLSDIVSLKKITAIRSTDIIKHGQYAYFVVLGAGFLYFKSKFRNEFSLYQSIEKFIYVTFYPLRLVSFLVETFINLMLGVISVATNEGKAQQGAQASESPFLLRLIFTLVILSFSIKLMILSVAYFFDGYYIILAFKGLASGYTALVTYFVLSKKWRDESSSEAHQIGRVSRENIVHDKNMTGVIHIGSLIEPKRMVLNLTWKDLNHHIHILGQPGSGKSILLRNIYAGLIKNHEGLLMIDLKADLNIREDFLSLCKFTNRLDDLIIVDISHPEQSFGYNPLSFGNATELKDKIISAITWSEPFYKKLSERVLLTVLRGLVWVRVNTYQTSTLADVLFVLESVQGITALADRVDDVEIKRDLNLMAQSATREFFNNLENLRSELSLLVKSEFGSLLTDSKALNIFKAINENKIILIDLDSQKFSESAKKLARMMIGDLRAASGQIVSNMQNQDRPRFTVIIDEVCDVISNAEIAESFVGFLNRCRGSGLGVVIAHQSLSDFVDERSMTQVLDSTETMISFVQKCPKTADTLAAIVGTREVMKVTDQIEENIFFKSKTGMGTQRLTQEYILHPNIVKDLNVGQAVYIAKKPSRSGILQVKMIEIPKSGIEVFDAHHNEEPAFMLNLAGHVSSDYKKFKSSMKPSDTSIGSRDVPTEADI